MQKENPDQAIQVWSFVLDNLSANTIVVFTSK